MVALIGNGLDYQCVLLVVAFTIVWARVAEVDGRWVVARAPWLWGLVGGGWTFVCRSLWGHNLQRVAFDQVVVLALMTIVIAIHDSRRTAGDQP